MPKNRNKKRDENHNCKVAPIKKLPEKSAPAKNLPEKNLPEKKPEKSLPVTATQVNNVTETAPPVSNVPVTTPLVSNEPVSNVPVTTPPVNNEPEKSLPDTKLLPKHPLNSKWTLWYYLPDKSMDWSACQHEIHTVDTVEDFWCFFDHLAQPSELINGCDYSFFKNGIRPMWEAPQNVNGGRLTVINTSKSRNININEIWQDVLLYLIGEYYEYSEDICGVVLNVRTYGIKVAIWTSHADKERLKSIGISIKKSLNLPFHVQLPFEVHAETQKSAFSSGRASSKNVFSV